MGYFYCIYYFQELDAIKKAVKAQVKDIMKFADSSAEPPASLAKELEYPDAPGTDYNTRPAPADVRNKS